MPPRTGSARQLDDFLAHVRDDRLYAAWRVLAMTWLRRGELLGLGWDAVDLVVQERLGHAAIAITLDIDSHAIPDMQEDLEVKIAALTRLMAVFWRGCCKKPRPRQPFDPTSEGRTVTLGSGPPLRPKPLRPRRRGGRRPICCSNACRQAAYRGRV